MPATTESRRRSILAILPVPDGTVGAADRRQVTWNYSGIASASASSENGPWYGVTAAGGSWRGSPVVAGSWSKPSGRSGSWVTPKEVIE